MIANIESIKNSSEFINNIRILLFYPFKADLTSEFKSQNDQIYCCDFKNRLTFNTKYFSGAAQFAIFQSKKGYLVILYNLKIEQIHITTTDPNRFKTPNPPSD